MTDTTDLTGWLRATLDRVEETARVAAALTRSPWVNNGSNVMCGDGFVVTAIEDGEIANAEHIAFWDPARVLRLVEATRRLIDDHPTIPEDWATDLAGDCQMCSLPAPCTTLRLSAMWLDDQPDYRAEWRP